MNVSARHVAAQNGQNLVGTWKLVSASTSTADGEKNEAPYGLNAIGFLTYTPDGRMNAIVMNGGRKALSVADQVAAPAQERAEAFATILAYAGHYSVTGDKVTHHVEAASIQNWVGTDLVRLLAFRGDQIILRTPPTPFRGKMITAELVWERLKN